VGANLLAIGPSASTNVLAKEKPAEAQHFSGLFHSLTPQGANGITRL
jgi:hypothetical protein